MSHIVKMQAKVHDPIAVAAACRRLGLSEPTQGEASLFSGQASGLLVKLPDWQYPLVVDTASGAVQFDHFEGRWGDPAHLDRFLQAYAVEKTKLEARKRGYTVSEQIREDGAIRVKIHTAATV